MNVMEEVTKLQQRLANAQRERARAEGAHAQAEAAAEQARQQLKQEFDVDSVEAAEHLLGDLKARLETVVVDLNQALDRIGVA